MPRPLKCRHVGRMPQMRDFKPRGVPMRDLREVYLPLDGLEAMRLVDLEGLDQAAAAARMGVSRQTLGRILAAARRNVAEALTEGLALRIEGAAHHQIADADADADAGTAVVAGGDARKMMMEDGPMKIAVSAVGETLDSEVDPHFGRAAGFVVVDAATMGVEYLSNTESGSLAHGAGIAAAERVARTGATVVLTGSVGPKAFQALTAAGLRIGQGVDGMTVRGAVEAFRCGEVVEANVPNSGGHTR